MQNRHQKHLNALNDKIENGVQGLTIDSIPTQENLVDSEGQQKLQSIVQRADRGVVSVQYETIVKRFSALLSMPGIGLLYIVFFDPTNVKVICVTIIVLIQQIVRYLLYKYRTTKAKT